MTAANLDADQPEEIRITGVRASRAEARVLSGEMHAKNDFEQEMLTTKPLPVTVEENGDLTLTLPACAVAEIRFS